MILSGLDGSKYSEVSTFDSAMLCSDAALEYLSILMTSFPRGMDPAEKGFEDIMLKKEQSNQFVPLTAREGLKELTLVLKNVHIPTNRTIFRSDRASNHLVLKGRLGRDKEELLKQLRLVLGAPLEEDMYNLRPEWARGL